MTVLTMYHNPRCSKSRQTLTLLQSRVKTLTVIEYLKQPPTVEQLQQVIDLLGVSPAQLLRTKESCYSELNLAHTELTDQQLIQVMCEHPILIERPIVFSPDQAVIGRPPENVLEIL